MHLRDALSPFLAEHGSFILFLLMNAPEAMQSIDREPLFFVPNLQSKKSVQLCLQYMSYENTVGKGEIVCNEQFLLFPQCFLTIWKTFC